ncbi:MAG: hypothetical protein HOL85_06460 [Rhodospirillaceae bacterium]|nr:hypothetical protein [Rhodospirillaceae bacterium]
MSMRLFQLPLLASLLAFVMAVVPFDAVGEVGKPRSLIPDSRTLDSRAPGARAPRAQPAVKPAAKSPTKIDETTTTETSPSVETSSDNSADPTKPEDGEVVTVDGLMAMTLEGIGTLDPKDGGFGTEMWAGTPRDVIERLLALLPRSPSSRTIRDLQRRLLLSATVFPPPTSTNSPADLLNIRSQMLFDIGARDDLEALLSALPLDHKSEVLARLRVDARLLAGDLARACATVPDWAGLSEDRYWQKALVFCQALGGAWGKVEFGIRLLIELGEEDEIFFKLMRAIGGETGMTAITPPRLARPLIIAMMRAARQRLPLAEGDMPADKLVTAYLGDAGTAFQERLRIAERAEAVGLASTDQLVKLYDAVEVGAELLESALSVAAADPNANSRALLFRAARMQPVDFGRAQAAQQAIWLAREAGILAQTSRTYRDLIGALVPQSAFGWFASDAAIALCATNRIFDAGPWLELARLEAVRDEDAERRWWRLWPIARLAGGDAAVPWDEAAIQNWWRGERDRNAATATVRAGMLFALFEALGEPVSPVLWRMLVDGRPGSDGKCASLALSRALAVAAADKRVGETVALTILAAGTHRLEETDPSVVTATIRALSDIGLVTEARALALEAALSWRL